MMVSSEEDSIVSSDRILNDDSSSTSSSSSLSSVSAATEKSGVLLSSKRELVVKEDAERTQSSKIDICDPFAAKGSAKGTPEAKTSDSTNSLSSSSITHELTDKEDTPPSSPDVQYPTPMTTTDEGIVDPENPSPELAAQPSPSYEAEEKKDDDILVKDTDKNRMIHVANEDTDAPIFRPDQPMNSNEERDGETLSSLINGVAESLKLSSAAVQRERCPSEDLIPKNSYQNDTPPLSNCTPKSYRTEKENALRDAERQNPFTLDYHDCITNSPQIRYFMPKEPVQKKSSKTPRSSNQKQSIRRQLKHQLKVHNKIHQKRSWQDHLHLQESWEQELQQKQDKVVIERERLQEQLRTVQPPVDVPIEMDPILKQEMDERWEIRVARREIIQQLELNANRDGGDGIAFGHQGHDEEVPDDEAYDSFKGFDDDSKSYESYVTICGLTRAKCLCWMFVVLAIMVIIASTAIVTYVVTLLRADITDSSLLVPSPGAPLTPTASPISSYSYPETPPPVLAATKTRAPTSVPKTPPPSLRPTSRPVTPVPTKPPTARPTDRPTLQPVAPISNMTTTEPTMNLNATNTTTDGPTESPTPLVSESNATAPIDDSITSTTVAPSMTSTASETTVPTDNNAIDNQSNSNSTSPPVVVDATDVPTVPPTVVESNPNDTNTVIDDGETENINDDDNNDNNTQNEDKEDKDNATTEGFVFDKLFSIFHN